jgi:hypothetical protein
MPHLFLLTSLHQHIHRRTSVQPVLKTFLSLQLQNLSGKLNHHCTDALYHSIGSTEASDISPLYCHTFSSLHRHIFSYSIGSTYATDLITIEIPQCTGQFMVNGVGLIGRPFSVITCPIHRYDHLDILTAIWTFLYYIWVGLYP